MPIQQSSLEDAPEAAVADVPHDTTEPGAADKSGDDAGAVSQDHAEATPNDSADAPESLTKALLGEEAEPEDKTEPEQQPEASKTDPPPDQTQKPPETEQGDGKKPADEVEEPKLTPEQERSVPKFARGRIKNLERKLEEHGRQLQAATSAVAELEARAMSAGFEQPDEVLDAVDLFGKAVKRRDPAAMAEVVKRLEAAGIKRAEPTTTGLDPAKVKALLKSYSYDALEALVDAAEAEPAKPQAKPAAAAEATPPPAQPDQSQTQQRQAQQPSPEALQAVGEMRAMADDLKRQHGDAAQAILAEIHAEVTKSDVALRKKTGAGILATSWGEEFRMARDTVLARRREAAQRTAPRQLRPSTGASTRHSGPSLTDELLETA